MLANFGWKIWNLEFKKIFFLVSLVVQYQYQYQQADYVVLVLVLVLLTLLLLPRSGSMVSPSSLLLLDPRG